MKRVLVLGAGKRSQGAVLPALWCMQDRFELAGVVARSVRELPLGGGRAAIVTRDSLVGLDLAGIDLVVVAVALPQVPKLLAELAREPVRRTVLMLDTPILPTSRLVVGRTFRAFRRVLASEDTIALPPFLLARRLIEQGAIGAVERILFFHNGYKYHALASLKLLAGGSPITRIVDRKYPGKIRMKELELANGVTAAMYEPRDYAVGKFLIQGARGWISDYDHPVGPAHRIGYILDGRVYRGLTLDGEPVPPAGLDAAYLDRIWAVPEASPMNTMKLRGLMDLLDAATDDASPFHYQPEQAVVDDIAYRLADRLGVVVGPSVIQRAIRMLFESR